MGAVMMRQDQSSTASDHRFGCIMGCKTLAPLEGEGGEGRVKAEITPRVHRFHKRYQCFSQKVKAVNPKRVKTPQDNEAALAEQTWGRAGRGRVSGAYIGKLPSQGSLGSPPSPLKGYRSSPLINDGSYLMGPCRGGSDPRKDDLCRKFPIVRPVGKQC